jgi:ribosomal 50S subunit-associated protein YjgA (DUF615 family)
MDVEHFRRDIRKIKRERDKIRNEPIREELEVYKYLRQCEETTVI